jgi:hypothetical protein
VHAQNTDDPDLYIRILHIVGSVMKAKESEKRTPTDAESKGEREREKGAQEEASGVFVDDDIQASVEEN